MGIYDRDYMRSPSVSANKPNRNVLKTSAAIVAIVLLYFVLARNAWLALSCSAIFIAVGSALERLTSRRKNAVAVPFAILATLALLVFILVVAEVDFQMLQHDDFDRPTGGTVVVFEALVEHFSWTGIGITILGCFGAIWCLPDPDSKTLKVTVEAVTTFTAAYAVGKLFRDVGFW